MIDKNKLSFNFSKYAQYYDMYCSVQKNCAIKLIEYIKEDNFKYILEIGAGTGNYTSLLVEKYPYSKIIALDISFKMLKIAKNKIKNKNVKFINTDAECFFTDKKFNLITSNVSFQWFENLEGSLYRYKDMLLDKGLIAFSIFGPKTFFELDLSIKEVFNKDFSIFSNYFLDRDKIYKMLKKLFKKIYIKKVIFKENYNSLINLLKTIKYTGTNFIIHKRKGLFSPDTLEKIQKIYIEKFNNIYATYEVYFIKVL